MFGTRDIIIIVVHARLYVGYLQTPGSRDERCLAGSRCRCVCGGRRDADDGMMAEQEGFGLGLREPIVLRESGA